MELSGEVEFQRLPWRVREVPRATSETRFAGGHGGSVQITAPCDQGEDSRAGGGAAACPRGAEAQVLGPCRALVPMRAQQEGDLTEQALGRCEGSN